MKINISIYSINIALAVFNIVLAALETTITPGPGIGHGRTASVVAISMWAFSLMPR